MMLNRRTPHNTFFVVMFLCCLISACSKSLKVVAVFPKPLIETLPIKVTLDYPSEFKSYVYKEKDKQRNLTNLEFGLAQTSLFNTVFQSVAQLTDSNQPSDIKIRPSLVDFQYILPSESKSKYFEVWLKYRVQLFDSENQELADWLIKGYGKSPTSTFASYAETFNKASTLALRDIGAQLSIGFSKQKVVQSLLQQKNSIKEQDDE